MELGGPLPSAVTASGLTVLSGQSADPYRADHSREPAQRPALVVLPRGTEDVARAVRLAAELGVPVVPRGAGSGLTGAANATGDALVLAMSHLPTSVEVDVERAEATVSASVTADAVRAAAAPLGLWYAPDPASSAWSTIGGNIATNAGGMCCGSVGRTADHLLEVEVVTAGGHVCRWARRGRQGGGTYDLVGLLAGSEGTLAVVTRAVLRLLPLPSARSTVVAGFPADVDVAAMVAGLRRRGVAPLVCEVMDRETLGAVDELTRSGLADHGLLLLLQLTGAEPALAAAEAVCRSLGATETVGALDADDARALFHPRVLALPALERRGSVLLDDVSVPLPRVRQVLADLRGLDTGRARLAVFGHALNGALHPTLTWERGDEAAAADARRAFHAIQRVAVAHGGSVAGEHGVGSLKRQAAQDELDPVTQALAAAVKRALDPLGTLNPGRFVAGPSPARNSAA